MGLGSMDKYEKAFEELQDHFLGKDFYIADPVSGEQAVKIITDTIKSTYPGAGESQVDKWRRKHKKCKWCIYHRHVVPPFGCCPSFCECVAKDKIINEDIPRPFCRLFALKKEE